MVGMGGSLLDPRGNTIIHYAWGLGLASNNIAEAYALFQDLRLTKDRNIFRIVSFEYFMMVVPTIGKRSHIENNLLGCMITRILSMVASFVEFKIYHIKHNLNLNVNHWVKVGSRLSKVEINLNGEHEVYFIP
jgi:hypothetical protein